MKTEAYIRFATHSALIVGLFGLCLAPAKAEDRKEERLAITRIIDLRTKGFNDRDGKAQAALFTDDADFYTSNGALAMKGPKQIERLLSRVGETIFKDAKLEQAITKIDFLSDHVAIATSALTMNRPESAGGTYQNRGLMVLVKKDGKWLIRTLMNQRVLPGAKILTVPSEEK